METPEKDQSIIEEMFIEDDGETENSDSHPGINKKKKSNTKTKSQLDTLVSFIQTNGDFTKGKADDSQLDAWDKLTSELNAMGPPYHSSLEWRKIWSDHKGNVKRKSSTPSTDVVKPKAGKVVKTDQSGSRYVEVDREHSDHPIDDKENIHSMYNVILKKIDALLEGQAETNALLKVLINILTPQSVDSP